MDIVVKLTVYCLIFGLAGCSRDLNLKEKPIYLSSLSQFTCNYSSVSKTQAEQDCGYPLPTSAPDTVGVFYLNLKLIEDSGEVSAKRIVDVVVEKVGAAPYSLACPETSAQGLVVCCPVILTNPATVATYNFTVTDPDDIFSTQTCTSP